MLFLTEETMRDIGDKLGQNFTEGELNELQDLLRHAASALEAFHASNTNDTAASLRKLADAVEAGEKRYRGDD